MSKKNINNMIVSDGGSNGNYTPLNKTEGELGATINDISP
jgi:hypothetical protein